MSKRLALHAFALVVVVACVTRAHAQDLDQDVVDAAADAGVPAIDLAGALNSLHLVGVDVGPRTYLIAEGLLLAAPLPIASGYPVRVRLTYYVEGGLTYGGGHTYAGSTACSWNFALGTRFRLPNGETVVCNDRGMLGSAGWLDLFRRPDLVRRYGPFAVVEVLP